MSTMDTFKRNSIQEAEHTAMLSHVRADVYARRLADVVLLRDYAKGCAQAIYESIVKSDSNLQGVMLDEYVKMSRVEATLYLNYRIFREAAAQAHALERMVDEQVAIRDESMEEWKRLYCFDSRDYASPSRSHNLTAVSS